MAIIKPDSSPSIDDCSSRREIVKILYNAAKKFMSFKEDSHIVFKEVALSDNYRCDVLSINWKERVTIIECKSCREDFLNDKKYRKYMDYCDYMYFICPREVIQKSEIPKEIGLIWVTGTLNNPIIHIEKSPKKLKPRHLSNSWLRYIFKKLAFRKFVKVEDKLISLEEERFFNT